MKTATAWSEIMHSLIQSCGAGVEVVKSRKFLGWVGVRFLTTLGVRVDFFVWLQLWMSNWIIFDTTLLNSEFLLTWYNFFKTFVESESCFAPQFPLILTAKFHSLYVKESEPEILEKLASRIFYLWLRNPALSTSISQIAWCTEKD